MAALFVAAALAAATPFEDVHDRFTLELPKGWQFQPQPGDLQGAVFGRNAEGIPAKAMVRVAPAPGGISARQLIEHVGQAFRDSAGYRSLKRGTARLGERRAARHRFLVAVSEDSKWQRMIEQRAVVVGGRGYVVHVESLAEAFARFQGEFNRIFTTFEPAGEASQTQQQQAGAADMALLDGPYIGRWRRQGEGTVLELRADGTFVLGEQTGTFRIQGKRLTFNLRDGKSRRFHYEVQEGSTLVLHPLDVRRRPAVFERTTQGRAKSSSEASEGPEE